ncbi:MAG TPA: CHAT domain-containing protein [Pyrinomonadaceae bacterium]|jgi:CHAT domain-containing protein/tetratricopeptide (TPR) repeat protein
MIGLKSSHIVFFTVLLFGINAFAQIDSPVKESIEPGKSLERSLKPDEQHLYSLKLERGQSAIVSVEQIGIDVALVLHNPDEKPVFQVNQHKTISQTESLLVLAETGGTFLILVSPASTKISNGLYRITVENPRAATEKDRQRFDAQTAVFEANELFLKESAAARRQALEKANKALALWKSLGDELWTAKILHQIGWINYWLEDYQPALEFLTQALALRRKINDRSGEAETLAALGSLYIYNNANQPARVIEYLEEAQKIQREIGNNAGAAMALYELGTFLFFTGNNQKAREKFEEALQLYRAEKQARGEANSLSNLGTIFLFTGEFQKALDAFRQALESNRILKDRIGEANSLNKIGQSYLKLNEINAALEYFEQSLKILDELDYKYSKGFVYTSIATVQYKLGERDKARLNFEKALEFHRLSKDRRSEATALLNLGKYYSETADKTKALDYLNQALQIARENADAYAEANILQSLGEISMTIGERPAAAKFFNDSLALKRTIKDPVNETVTLYSLGKLEKDSGNLKTAWEQISKAVEIIESLRSSVINPQLRSSYFASQQDFYGLAINILMDLHQLDSSAGYDKLALEMNERARARSLLELLGEARADIRKGVDNSLLTRERAIQQNINFKESRRLQLVGGKYTPAEIEAADREIGALLAEYEQIQDRIRVISPAYAALAHSAPLKFKDIQSQLDAETVLLVYRLRGDKSYLWVVTPAEVKSFLLPERAAIEKQALEFYNLLQASFRRAARLQTQNASAALGKMLLGPAAQFLENKRLLIVADGALQYLPFASLTLQNSKSAAENRFLIETNEIVNIPSVTILAELRRISRARNSAPKTLAVFADPVFTPEDERLKADKQIASAANTGTFSKLSRAAQESAGVRNFSRLRFTRREAEEISGFLPSSMQLKVLDFAASRENLLKQDLSQYRILHIATHGILNNQRPELSGLVFSLINEKGAAQEGFLRANEIYNLKLAADLVVLSACRTALGKEVGGEGLISLTRGFFYAGTPRVVVSLWNIDDESTAELMRLFYKSMLQDKLAPAAALRKAQQEMQKNPRFSAPYYWSGFILQGDWR